MTEQETKPETKPVLPDIPTSWERFSILIIYGLITLYMASLGNLEAMTLSAANLATYFLSRQGA